MEKTPLLLTISVVILGLFLSIYVFNIFSISMNISKNTDCLFELNSFDDDSITSMIECQRKADEAWPYRFTSFTEDVWEKVTDKIMGY